MGKCRFHREQGCLGQLLLLIKGTWCVHRGESQKNLAGSSLQKCQSLSQVHSRRTNRRHSRKPEDRIILNFQVNISLRSENVFSWVGSFAIKYYDCNSCFLELIGFSTSLKLFLLPHSLSSSSRISRSWGGACSRCSILSAHTQDASAMPLSGRSLKRHSDYSFMDYVLENGLGEAFET